ncbi:porin [Sulfitobacter sp. OXR-159]|uniref:porin n=1 Tax=Sulfitobacter sp. OXR-159 TaxID=3100174 RepID=UPI002AC8CC69|nr:porin [Sulfitobacter sp. OXR-159]WPZ29856.1 porin [Sulfitobacter sp. OXR-159]
MKKVLFATTALVATAGVAAADVTFGGYGRFGVLYSSAAGPDGLAQTFGDDGTGDSSTDLTYRFRLQLDATAESDAGVVFGARVRIEQENDEVGDAANSGTGINAPRFFARSGGLEVGVGNIYGAIEAMPGMYPIDLGLTGLEYQYSPFQYGADFYDSDGAGASAGSAGTGAPFQNAVEVMYSFGDLSVHVSASEGARDRVAAHVAYTWSGWTFALGGQDSNSATDTEWLASAGGSLGAVDVSLAYADNGANGDQWTLAGRYDVSDATNIEFYVSDAETYFGNPTSNNSYGVDFNHDLGGGTSLRGGVAKLFQGHTVADMGVRFNF